MLLLLLALLHFHVLKAEVRPIKELLLPQSDPGTFNVNFSISFPITELAEELFLVQIIWCFTYLCDSHAVD